MKVIKDRNIKKIFKDKFQFKHNVKIVGGAGDNAAAAARMGIIETNQSFISLRTSGVSFTPTKDFLSNTGDAVPLFVIACLIVAFDVGDVKCKQLP